MCTMAKEKMHVDHEKKLGRIFMKFVAESEGG
jgi:hypothetical protein